MPLDETIAFSRAAGFTPAVRKTTGVTPPLARAPTPSTRRLPALYTAFWRAGFADLLAPEEGFEVLDAFILAHGLFFQVPQALGRFAQRLDQAGIQISLRTVMTRAGPGSPATPSAPAAVSALRSVPARAPPWAPARAGRRCQARLHLRPVEAGHLGRVLAQHCLGFGAVARGLLADTRHQRVQVEVRAGRGRRKFACLVHLPPLVRVRNSPFPAVLGQRGANSNRACMAGA